MKNGLYRLIVLLVTAGLLLSLGGCQGKNPPEETVPLPTVEQREELKALVDRYEEGEGSFFLDEQTRLFAATQDPEGELAECARFLSSQFAAEGVPSQTPMTILYGEQSQSTVGDIVLISDCSDLGAEGYEIRVTPEQILLRGADSRGLMYGGFMLIKCLRANGSNGLEACVMADTPDAGERVVMLDCGRKYYSPAWICNFIRQCAFMGYNAIELRFSEDQGTRFDIWDPEYFKDNRNGNDFSWICGGYVGSWVKNVYHDYEDQRKYLRPWEIHEIMETAAEYQIDVIPAMNGPGHCQYLCRSYVNNSTISLEFTYDGLTYYYRGVKENGSLKATSFDLLEQYPNLDFFNIFAGNHITLDVTNPCGRAFHLAVLEDYARFFRQYGCEVFHIGGDEVRLHTNGYGSVDWQDYVQPGYSKYDTCVDYINEETALLKEMGYRVRAYNDFMDYVSDDPDYDQHIQYDPDIELSYWICDYDLETVAPVDRWLGERKIYNCLQNYCYYALTESDLGKDGRDPDTRNWDFYYSTEDRIYNHWNPTVFQWPEDPGKGLIADPEQIAGGYFLIWCDNAAQSTEEEIWKGIDETGKYNVIDRMWSNTAKLWNYDLNDTLSYEDYAALREDFGLFPGYTDCSDATAIPEAPQLTAAPATEG